MTTTKHKIFLILLGLIIIFLSLEISLRLAGYIYYQLRIVPQEQIPEETKNAIRILCLGDSVTFGLGAERGYDYPAQLERMLNENYPEKKFIVYNQGYPGKNSSQVLKHLEDNIEKYKPSIIILLTGNNNRFNLVDSNYHLFEDNIYGRTKRFLSRLDILLMRIRIYKLLKITLLRLKDTIRQKIFSKIKDKDKEAKYVKLESIDTSSQLKSTYKEDLDLASEYYGQRKFNMAKEKLEEVLVQDSTNQKALVLLGEVYIELEKYDLALTRLREAVLNSPEDAWAHRILGKLYYRQGRNNPPIKEKNFELSVKELNKSIECTDNSKDKVWAYYTLSEVFFEQGKVDLAIEAIENALKYQPNDEFLQKQLRVVSKNPNETPEERKVFDKLLYYDLDCIAAIVRNHGLELILLGYPDITYRNEIRKQVANKYNILFIDFVPIFADLLTKYHYKDLFSNDAGHLNANGYRIIAKTVAKIIVDGNKGIKKTHNKLGE